MTKVIVKVPIDINKHSFIYIVDLNTEKKLITYNIYDEGIFYPRGISEYWINDENEFCFMHVENEYYFDKDWAILYLRDNERLNEKL